MSIYVGNINYKATDEQLKRLIEEVHGPVISCNIIINHETGISKGFAFVDVDHNEASAIENLNRMELMGRLLVVKKATPRNGDS